MIKIIDTLIIDSSIVASEAGESIVVRFDVFVKVTLQILGAHVDKNIHAIQAPEYLNHCERQVRQVVRIKKREMQPVRIELFRYPRSDHFGAAGSHTLGCRSCGGRAGLRAFRNQRVIECGGDGCSWVAQPSGLGRAKLLNI